MGRDMNWNAPRGSGRAGCTTVGGNVVLTVKRTNRDGSLRKGSSVRTKQRVLKEILNGTVPKSPKPVSLATVDWPTRDWMADAPDVGSPEK